MKKYRVLYDEVEGKLFAEVFVDSGRNRKGVYLGSSGLMTNLKRNFDDALFTCIKHAITQHNTRFKQYSNDSMYYQVIDCWAHYYGGRDNIYEYKVEKVKGKKKEVIYRRGQIYSVQDYSPIGNKKFKFNPDSLDLDSNHQTFGDVKELKEHSDII